MNLIEGIRRAILHSSISTAKLCFANSVVTHEAYIRYLLPVWIARYSPHLMYNYLSNIDYNRYMVERDNKADKIKPTTVGALRSRLCYSGDEVIIREVAPPPPRAQPTLRDLWYHLRNIVITTHSQDAFVYLNLKDSYDLPYFNRIRNLKSYDELVDLCVEREFYWGNILSELRFMPMKTEDMRLCWAAICLRAPIRNFDATHLLEDMSGEPAATRLLWWAVDFPEETIHKMSVEAGLDFSRVLEHVHLNFHVPWKENDLYYTHYLRELFGDRLGAIMDIYQYYVSCYFREEHFRAEREISIRKENPYGCYITESLQSKPVE